MSFCLYENAIPNDIILPEGINDGEIREYPVFIQVTTSNYFLFFIFLKGNSQKPFTQIFLYKTMSFEKLLPPNAAIV